MGFVNDELCYVQGDEVSLFYTVLIQTINNIVNRLEMMIQGRDNLVGVANKIMHKPMDVCHTVTLICR
jgi:hypothetical protein